MTFSDGSLQNDDDRDLTALFVIVNDVSAYVSEQAFTREVSKCLSELGSIWGYY